ncbi:MAG: hypothetical protein M1148_02065 [Candidatus Thermoplasmatota archaeon]|nr:hypothetical protein [Candidatus Thermoplasmatota archaeon]
MPNYTDFMSFIKDKVPSRSIVSLDLETLVKQPGGFLSGERIIAVSMSYGLPDVKTEIFVAEDDSDREEYRILNHANTLMRTIDPSVIIGYNHSGYDIPLIQIKIKKYPYDRKLRSLEYYLGTAWCLDMMYVISDDLAKDDGDRYIRKLDDVVIHDRYAKLDLKRVKGLARRPGMNKGQAIEEMWKNDRDSFRSYCEGDTHDLLIILQDILSSQ